MIARQIILASWVIFVAYWLIRARKVKTVAERQPLAGRLANAIPVALGALLLNWRRSPYPLSVVLLPHTNLTAACGAGLCVVGLMGAVWARRALADNWSGFVTFKVGHELVETGPYRFVRHPIYTSLLLMVLGTVVAAGLVASLLGFFIFFLGFWIKIKQEEELMMRHFPQQYPHYKSRVKALVPFLF
jgi:protein-S-isoprenylcysteine O-methyltransferase Ste14